MTDIVRLSDGRLRACLAESWGLVDATVEVHNGGMNSATWLVSEGAQRWVAKAVAPASRRSFSAGLAVAMAVEAAGIPAGAPVAARNGEFVVDVDGLPLALLTWVAGAALSGADSGEQRVIAATLAAVHRGLRGVSVPDGQAFHWVDPRGEHLGIRPWIRDAVAATVAAYEDLDPSTLSWGLLHTDPAPEAFLLDPARGICGLIDWSTAMTGPLLYDLASAVMFVGGPHRAVALVAAYLDQGIVPRTEVDRGLLVLLRFRWSVQADYFARRIAVGDLTGIAGPAENEAGLEDARRWLDRWRTGQEYRLGVSGRRSLDR